MAYGDIQRGVGWLEWFARVPVKGDTVAEKGEAGVRRRGGSRMRGRKMIGKTGKEERERRAWGQTENEEKRRQQGKTEKEGKTSPERVRR